MKPWIQWGLVPGVLCTLATCTLTEDSCACTRIAPGVIVAGQATDSSGTGLEGVAVSLRLRDASCAADLALPLSVATDSVGQYALYQDGIAEGTEVCGDVEGLRFSTSGVDTVLVTGVPLTSGFGDTHRLDLVFPDRQGT